MFMKHQKLSRGASINHSYIHSIYVHETPEIKSWGKHKSVIYTVYMFMKHQKLSRGASINHSYIHSIYVHETPEIKSWGKHKP